MAGKVSGGVRDPLHLIRGTGLGMCIVANKFPGVLCRPLPRRPDGRKWSCLCDWNGRPRLSGDILVSAWFGRLVSIWLHTEFEGGRHALSRKIADLESGGNGKG